MKNILKILKTTFPIVLGVIFIIYAYEQFTPEQLDEIVSYFSNANYYWLVLSLFFGFLSHLSRAYRWNFLLEPMGYHTRYINSVMAIFIAYLMNVLIPRSGEVSRAIAVQKYEDIPFQKGFGTIITERIIDLVLLVLFVLLALFIQFDVVEKYILSKIELAGVFKLLAIVVVIGVAVYVFFKRKTDSPILLKIKKFLKGLEEGLLSIVRMKKRGAFIFHTLFIWAMYLLMFYVAAFALKETSDISFGATITTFIVGGIAIAFTNGGFGSYPALVAGILLLYNIPLTAGTAFGWIVWTAQFAMFVIFGSLSFILLPIINRKPASEETD